MNRAAMICVCAMLGLGAASVAPAYGGDEPVLRFRGAGKTRSQLDALQLKPFDQSLWATLSSWNGTAPKAEDLSGKVVLIVTWASWHKLSHPAMRTAQSLLEKYKDQGLVVVGVHNPSGFEGAADNAKTLGVTFPYAVDKDGKFRAGVIAGQDPNVYVIDRAGDLRYAQVDAASMEDAVAHLVKETAEQAADYPKSLAKLATETDRKRWLTKDVTGPAPGEEPAVDFPEPDEDAYKAARWPYMVGKVEKDPIFDKIRHEAPKIQSWPEEDWVPAAPKRAGKLVVVYFMDPKEVDMLNVIPAMNRLHDEYKRDVVVAGALFKLGANSLTGNDSGVGGEEDEKLKQRNKDAIATILRTRSVNHYLNPAKIRAENLELLGGGMVPRLSPSRDEIGICIVLSSDLRMRWIGNPYDQDLKVALDKLIAVDPGVKARRKAEDAKKH
jgi:hypothetical protein